MMSPQDTAALMAGAHKWVEQLDRLHPETPGKDRELLQQAACNMADATATMPADQLELVLDVYLASDVVRKRMGLPVMGTGAGVTLKIPHATTRPRHLRTGMVDRAVAAHAELVKGLADRIRDNALHTGGRLESATLFPNTFKQPPSIMDVAAADRLAWDIHRARQEAELSTTRIQADATVKIKLAPIPKTKHRAMTTHDLKVWPAYYIAIIEGRKTFEFRKDDRGYRVGDILYLREWDPLRINPEKQLGILGVLGGPGAYTGRRMTRRISSILQGGEFHGPAANIPTGYVVLSFKLADGSTFEMPTVDLPDRSATLDAILSMGDRADTVNLGTEANPVIVRPDEPDPELKSYSNAELAAELDEGSVLSERTGKRVAEFYKRIRGLRRSGDGAPMEPLPDLPDTTPTTPKTPEGDPPFTKP